MSLFGLRVAREYGAQLPTFPSQEAAQRALFKHRDECLAYLGRVHSEALDFSGESLKLLEAWYFSHFTSGDARSGELVRQRVEEALAVYFGEALVRSGGGWHWAVKPFAFTPGTYELAVCRPLQQIGISRETDLFSRPNNKRHQSIYRRFNQYAG